MERYYINNIKKSFDDLQVLDNISIHFIKGTVTCILGPSGCGKSTLLNIISGIINDYRGEVVGFEKEKVSFVFQEDRLVPWLSVYDNMKLILKNKHSKEELNAIIGKYISMVGMKDYLYFYPTDLSGGMKQRVSIARALAYGGEVIIMDEPFKSLDIKNKIQLLRECKKIFRDNETTVIFVTHDIDEAIEISDCIYVLSDKPTHVKSVWEDVSTKTTRENIFSELVGTLLSTPSIESAE